ncbi:hypothetical protein GJ688_04120 [Heliobacillus mobilis]|uniref:SdpI family protein n=1 Tax=Heliobacterium mobile TaxID=28064 RepID=A0A6I3SH45_HELMO|nr:SdpI family protein [Heliobacterium mobile]MTV48169.1 hypothetical protein [Heliobacterium mobile]
MREPRQRLTKFAMNKSCKNVTTRMRQNYFMGTRLPWTLADRDIWAKTHHLGGRIFVASGFGMIAIGMLTPFISETLGMALFLTVILSLLLVPAIYAWWIFQKRGKGQLN